MRQTSGRRSRSLFRLVRPWLGLLSVATLALFVIAVVVPGLAILALRWYLVGVAVLAAAATMQAILTRFPTHERSRDNPFARPPGDLDEQPQRLREIERLVSYSRWSAADYDERLRPILYAIARQRLSAYRSISVDTEAGAAETLLGTSVWALIAPSQGGERADRMINLAELGTVVAALEGINAAPRH